MARCSLRTAGSPKPSARTGLVGPLADGLIVTLTAARYLTAFGFLTCASLERPHWAKAIGAVVTYIAGIILAGYLVGYGSGLLAVSLG